MSLLKRRERDFGKALEMKGNEPKIYRRREHGISPTTFYKWRSKFAGTYGETSPEKKRIEALEEESRRLKELLGEIVLENSILKELLAKKGK
jgi:transposase-like protein